MAAVAVSALPCLAGQRGFGAHCQSRLGAAAVQDPLAVETLSLFFKAFSVNWLPAVGLSTFLQGLFPTASTAWALLATLLALAQQGFHRQLFWGSLLKAGCPMAASAEGCELEK